MITEKSAGATAYHILQFPDCKGHLKQAEALKSQVCLRVGGAAAVVLLCKQTCCQCVGPSHHTERFFKWTVSLCHRWLFSFSCSLVHGAWLYSLHPKTRRNYTTDPISWWKVQESSQEMYDNMISNISRGLYRWANEAFKEQKIKNVTYDQY